MSLLLEYSNLSNENERLKSKIKRLEDKLKILECESKFHQSQVTKVINSLGKFLGITYCDVDDWCIAIETHPSSAEMEINLNNIISQNSTFPK